MRLEKVTALVIGGSRLGMVGKPEEVMYSKGTPPYGEKRCLAASPAVQTSPARGRLSKGDRCDYRFVVPSPSRAWRALLSEITAPFAADRSPPATRRDRRR